MAKKLSRILLLPHTVVVEARGLCWKFYSMSTQMVRLHVKDLKKYGNICVRGTLSDILPLLRKQSFLQYTFVIITIVACVHIILL